MTDNSATKKCPDCAEEVRAKARKCRFCGFIFSELQAAQSSLDLPGAGYEPAVEEATGHPQSHKPVPSGLGRTQARIILGLVILLVVWIGYLFFEDAGSDITDAFKALAIIVIAAVLIYFAAMADGRKAKIKIAQDAKIVCAQCHSVEHVTTSAVTLKKGISGGKATGAVLTGGLSLFAVGLSRKEDATEAKCSKCGSVWHF